MVGYQRRELQEGAKDITTYELTMSPSKNNVYVCFHLNIFFNYFIQLCWETILHFIVKETLYFCTTQKVYGAGRCGWLLGGWLEHKSARHWHQSPGLASWAVVLYRTKNHNLNLNVTQSCEWTFYWYIQYHHCIYSTHHVNKSPQWHLFLCSMV